MAGALKSSLREEAPTLPHSPSCPSWRCPHAFPNSKVSRINLRRRRRRTKCRRKSTTSIRKSATFIRKSEMRDCFQKSVMQLESGMWNVGSGCPTSPSHRRPSGRHRLQWGRHAQSGNLLSSPRPSSFSPDRQSLRSSRGHPRPRRTADPTQPVGCRALPAPATLFYRTTTTRRSSNLAMQQHHHQMVLLPRQLRL